MSGLEASLLLGSMHSVVLAIVLRRRDRNRRANQYLAALLVAMSLLLFDGFFRARGVLLAHPHLIGLTAWVPFVIGPLVFLYVREMTASEPARIRSPWRHFVVPGGYVALLLVTFFPRSASYKLDVARHGGPWFIEAVEAALLVYGITYALAALVLLRRHRAQVQQIYSNLRGVSLRWLLVLSVLNTFVWCAALAGFLIRMSGVADAAASSAIVPIGSTITVFVIGYFQLGQAEIYVGQPVAAEPPTIESQPAKAAAPLAAEPQELRTVDQASSRAVDHANQRSIEERKPAYQRARLAEEDAVAVEARIKAAMTEQKLYQRPGLTLSELADEVAATPHEVSQVLSTRLQRNFYNFINEHRIEHVKRALVQTDRPVLDLAFEAGFQSKSTFNSAFRKATGTTPREFRERASA